MKKKEDHPAIVEDYEGKLNGIACHIKAEVWQDWPQPPWRIHGLATLYDGSPNSYPDGMLNPTNKAWRELEFQCYGENQQVSVVLNRTEWSTSKGLVCEFTTDAPGG